MTTRASVTPPAPIPPDSAEDHSSMQGEPRRLAGSLALACCGLLAMVVLVYSPVYHAEFVHLDDFLHVTENPHVKQGLTGQSLTWAFTTVHAGYWIPVTWISHMVDVEFHGLDAGGHHVTNVVLHGLNVCLLLLCLLRLTGSPWRSFAVASLFALHPLHVESVAWIAERKDVLSTFFWFLAILLYIQAIRQGGGLRRMVPVAACMLLGIMAKPMLVTLPLSLLLLDFWPMGRLRTVSARRLLLEKWPLFVVALSAGALTLMTQKGMGATAPWTEWGLWPRVSTALAGYGGYLQKLFAPFDLAAYYPLQRETSLLQWVTGGALLVALSLLAWRVRRTAPYLLMGWLWFVFLLLPVSGLLQSGTQALADRFVYVPIIGVYVAMVWGVGDLLRRRPGAKGVVVALFVGILVALAVMTWRQSRHWENSVTLQARIVEVTPDNIAMRTGLARECARRQDWDCAGEQYRLILEQEPENALALYGLGLMRHQQGRDEDALALLQRSLALDPDHAFAHNALGAVLHRLDRPEEARAAFSRALELNPDLEQTRRLLERLDSAASE